MGGTTTKANLIFLPSFLHMDLLRDYLPLGLYFLMVQIIIIRNLEWRCFIINGQLNMDNGWERALSPTITVEGLQIHKSEDNWDEKDSLSAKAKNGLVWALSSKEFIRVCNCDTTRKIGHFRGYAWGHKPSQKL